MQSYSLSKASSTHYLNLDLKGKVLQFFCASLKFLCKCLTKSISIELLKLKFHILPRNLSAAGFMSPPDFVEVDAGQSHLAKEIQYIPKS